MVRGLTGPISSKAVDCLILLLSCKNALNEALLSHAPANRGFAKPCRSYVQSEVEKSLTYAYNKCLYPYFREQIVSIPSRIFASGA